MTEIARGCVCCEPLVDPKFERLGEQHFAFRLGDAPTEVFFDGVVLDRDAALQLASQLKRAAQTGPQLLTPPAAGKLVVPGA